MTTISKFESNINSEIEFLVEQNEKISQNIQYLDSQLQETTEEINKYKAELASVSASSNRMELEFTQYKEESQRNIQQLIDKVNELQKVILSGEKRLASNEREIESLQRRLTALEKPDSKEESNPSPHRNYPPKTEIKKIKEIRGGAFHPRPTIVFEDNDTVNVWNHRAPFGNAVGNWKPQDPIALTRNFGGNGIDPDRATNLNQYDPGTNQHEAVNGNRKGNPFTCKTQ